MTGDTCLKLYLNYTIHHKISVKRQKACFTETYVGLQIQNDDNIHASLTPPLFFYFIKVPAPSQKSERSCILCVTGTDFASFYKVFYWILEMFRQRDIFCFSLSAIIMTKWNVCLTLSIL